MTRRGSRYIKVTGDRTYAIDEFRDQVSKIFDQLVENQATGVAVDVAEELELLLAEISNSSAHRGRGRFAAKYDDPLNPTKSPIKIKITSRRRGRITYRVEVDNPIFNILDAGSPDKTASNVMRFPRYRGGPSTNPGRLVVGTPANILDRGSEDAEFFGGGWVTINPGQKISGFEPRNFYKSIIEKLKQRNPLVRQGFVKSKIIKRS